MSETKTQCDRVLIILSDGNWHSQLEFARLERPILRLSARVFELRRIGFKVDMERQPDGVFRYRMPPTL